MKYLEVPDFHFDPRWSEVSESCAESVAQAAKHHGVDFIAVPGDFFNHPIYASDKGGMNVARRILSKWLDICPVVAIEGTPSHDAPGAYGFLEDVGLVLLKPYMTHAIGQAIIFGIPELSTENIHAKLNVGSLEANAMAERCLAQYVAEWIAPMRARYPDHVAVGMIHGNITDSHRENQSDIILKSSDILIRTEDLRPAMLDRWAIGHIHTPWESSVISAGYAGFPGLDDNPWGKTGFVPCFNLVEISEPGAKPVITRVPYGTPMRLKITRPPKSYSADVAYWLDTDDDTAVCPDAHPWSRITRKAKDKIQHVAEIQADASLVDMFRAWDKEAPASALAKVETMEQTFATLAIEPIQVELKSVEIQGGIFWKSRHIKLDLASLPSGINAIRGDNGDGKSSLLAFCTPYPLVVGKDTESGRDSAIKDFFDQPDSWIEKVLTRNGVEHRHKIAIKAAHTKSAKTECFLYVDGINQLATTSFDEMLATCEKLYGPYADYLITSFYIQPDQSQQRSGLMASKRIDAQKIVQTISGVDRSRESRHALDQKAKYERMAGEKSAFIAGLESGLSDPATLESNLEVAIQSEARCTVTVKSIEVQGREAGEKATQAKSAYDLHESELARKQNDTAELDTAKAQIATYASAKADLESNRAKLAEIESYKEASAKNKTIKAEYDAQVQAWNTRRQTARQAIDDHNRKLTQGHQDAQRAYSSKLDDLERKAKADAMQVSSCPKCGYVDPDADELWQSACRTAEEARAELASLTAPVAPVMTQYPADEPQVPQPVYLHEEVPFHSENEVREALKVGEIASVQIGILEAKIAELEAKTYSLDPESASRYLQAKQAHENLQAAYRTAFNDLGTAQASVNFARKEIERQKEQAVKISDAKADMVDLQADATDWAYIAKGLQSSNIPAMELERNLDAIDREATAILSPFMSGQFSIRTEAVDGFDIMIHDGETGEETSFFKRNPGHKAFFADAYTKSLIQRRNERQHRSYSPIVMDEADAPIQEARIGMYYEMQDRYFGKTDARVLVVSQKDPAYIQNAVFMRDITK